MLFESLFFPFLLPSSSYSITTVEKSKSSAVASSTKFRSIRNLENDSLSLVISAKRLSTYLCIFSVLFSVLPASSINDFIMSRPICVGFISPFNSASGILIASTAFANTLTYSWFFSSCSATLLPFLAIFSKVSVTVSGSLPAFSCSATASYSSPIVLHLSKSSFVSSASCRSASSDTFSSSSRLRAADAYGLSL